MKINKNQTSKEGHSNRHRAACASRTPGHFWPAPGVTGDEVVTSSTFVSALQWKLRIDGNAFIFEKRNKSKNLTYRNDQVAVMAPSQGMRVGV